MKPSSGLHPTRMRLLDALDGPAPLVVVSAPAGAGKTFLLDEWCAEQEHSTLCRVVLEDDETLFWQPVLSSLTEHGLPLQPLTQRLGRNQLLGRQLVGELLAALAASGRRWTLVVDGYELTSPALAEEVEGLLDNAEGSLRLVLSARLDPALRLYRRRLQGTLNEIRAADLAFTDEEASELFARSGTPMPRQAVHALNTRMGGWVTGLRFAAQALAHHVQPADVVSALATSDLDLTEYLLHEVLDVQQRETRDLLLRTCVPDILTRELTLELVGQDGVRRLAELQRSNLFLEGADGGSLRYPPFFRDLLRAQLAQEDPALSARLHRQVAAWFRVHEEWERASMQLATGGLWEDLAQQLIDDLFVPRLLLGEDDPLRSAASRIPAEIVTPSAYVVRAALAFGSGDHARCAENLQHVPGAVGASPSQSESWTWSEALVTAAHAACAGGVEVGEAAVDRCSRQLSTTLSSAARLVSPEVEGMLQVASARLAMRQGELGRALVSLTQVAALPGLSTRLRVSVLSHVALAQALAGQLTRACDSAHESLALADDLHLPADRRSPAGHAALALVALERHDLESVNRHLGHARVCRAIVDDPVSRAVVAGASKHLEAQAGAYRPWSASRESSDMWNDVRDPWLLDWLTLQVASAALAHGHPNDALEVLATLSGDTGLSGELLSATAYAEQGRTVALSRSLLHAAPDDPSPVTRVNRLLVEAVQEANRHSMRAAGPLVMEALEIASQEAIRRPFLAAPPSIGRVLAAHQQLLDLQPWLRPDLSSPEGRTEHADVARPPLRRQVAVANASGAAEIPVEPLTPREREVLGHLDELLTTEEIAQLMFVSVNTVRTHIRNILRKLDVHRRSGAVRRARELALLEPSSSITRQG